MAELDPYRTIPGEPYHERIRRIRRETGNNSLFGVDKSHPMAPRNPANAAAIEEASRQFWNPSQRPNETNPAFLFRDAGTAPLRAIGNVIGEEWEGIKAAPGKIMSGLSAVGGELAKFGNWMTETPARAATRQPQAQPQPAAAQVFTPAAAQQQTAAVNPNARSYRNNNPGALKASAWTQGQPGYAGMDSGGLAIFETPEAGERAQRTLVQNYIKRGFDTPAKIVGRWAPVGPENSPESVANYTAHIARTLGIGPNDKVTPAQADGIIQAQREFEGGTWQGGGGTNITGQLSNPFDPRFHQAALGEIDRSEAESLKPMSYDIARPAAPELPKPEALPRTDFTAADAALAELRPVEMTEKEKLKMQRRGWLQGLGQALASLPDGAGLGKVLAAMGGGALAGRGAADQDIERKMERIETRLAQWKGAVFQQESDKAQTSAREAQAEVQNLNEYAYRQYQNLMSRWEKDNRDEWTENGLVSTRIGADGQGKITITPHAPAVKAAAALRRAQILGNIGSEFHQSNSLVARAQNGYTVAMLAQKAANDPNGEEAREARVAIPALVAQDIVSQGRMSDVIGDPQAYQVMEQSVRNRLERAGVRQKVAADPANGVLEQPGLSPSEYLEKYQEAWVDQMYRFMATIPPSDPIWQRGMMGFESSQARDAADRYRSRSTRRSVNSRGGVSYSESYSGED